MNSKHTFKMLLAMLLVLCTLFSTCAVFSSCGLLNQTTPPAEEPLPEEETPPSSSQIGTCTHAETTLRDVREATCARDGYTGNEVCTACGAIVKAGETTTTPHTFGKKMLLQNATCSRPGIEAQTCSVCKYVQKTYTSLGECDESYHDAMDDKGHLITCDKCAKNDYGEHTPQGAGAKYAATCIEGGYILYTCRDCDASYKVWQENEPSVGHDWNDWIVTEPTCRDNGSQTRTCANCTERESMTIPTSDDSHHFVEIDRVKATCQEEGSIDYECSVCQAYKSVSIPVNKNSHQLGTAVVEGSWSVQSCERSGCEYEVKTFNVQAGTTQAEMKSTDIDETRTFEIKTEAASIQFPTEVIKNLQNAENVEIKAGVVDNKSAVLDAATNIDEATKARLEKENVQIFDFSVTDGSNSIAFGEGNTVTVTIPYTLGDDEEPDGIVVWHVEENGVIKSYPATYEDGFVTFEALHFSYYAVAYQETQEMKCRRGEHRYPANSGEVVAPTCWSYGYTIVECDTCHRHELLDITEKLGHNYGEVIAFVPTCTEGGYDVKACQTPGCSHTMNFTYQRALGHDLDKPATCTEPSVCQRTGCHAVVTPAKGHEWSEWQIVIEPTTTTAGLRRKHCPHCGEYQDIILAATGSVEEISFENYEDLLDHAMENLLGFHNGKASFEFFLEEEEATITMDLSFKQEGESYVMLINATENGYGYYYGSSLGYSTSAVVQSNIGTDHTEINANRNDLGNQGQNIAPAESVRYTYEHTIEFLYRNGVVVLLEERVSPYHDADESIICSDDLESLIQMPYKVLLEYLNKCFDLYVPDVEATFDEFAALLRIAEALGGEGVNDLLSEFGCSYDVGMLADLFDKAQMVYTYLALRYGFDTTLDLKSGVAMPTPHDFLTVLNGFCTTAKNADGSTTYTLDYAEVKRAFNAILTWIETNKETALSTLFFTVFGERVQEYYPEVNTWEAFIDKLSVTFTGSMTQKEALNTVIDMLEKHDICTLEELYNIIDALVLNLSDEEFDTEKHITENGTMTLDETAQEMGFANIAEFFTKLKEELAQMKLGELVLDYRYRYDPETQTETRVDHTLMDLVAKIREEVDLEDISAALSFTLDAQGKLLAIDLDEEIIYRDEQNNAHILQYATASFGKDDNVKIDIPAEFAPVSQVKLEATFDAAGNMLLIVPEGFAYEFSVGGYGEVPFSALVEKDEALTQSQGYPVYVLKKDCWTNQKLIAQYLHYNGKFYNYTSGDDHTPSYYIVTEQYTIDELLADPTVLLPDIADAPFAVCKIDGNRYNAYSTMLMSVFQKDDVWYAIKSYDYNGEYYDEITHTWITEYDNVEYVPFDSALTGMQLGMADEYYYYDAQLNGEAISVLHGYFSLNPDVWGSETVSAQFYLSDNDEIMLVNTQYVSGQWTYYYQLDEEVSASDIPAYDFINEYDWDINNSREIRDAEGNVLSNVKMTYLYAYAPDYFVKINDELYAQLNYYSLYDDETGAPTGEYRVYLPEGICAKLATNGKATLRMSDGNKMYIWGEVNNSGHTNTTNEYYDRIVYGYVKLQGDLYIQAACRYNGTKLVDEIYRNNWSECARPSKYMSYSDFINAAQYVKRINATTYKIDAKLFSIMRGICTHAGDSYWINVTGTKTVGDNVYEFRAAEGIYYSVPDPEGLYYYGYEYEHFYWNDYFLNDGYSTNYLFSVTPNTDGSLTVTAQNGEEITLRYYTSNGYPVDDFIPKDEVMSEQTGLEIYSAITGMYTDTYLYDNGKYYYYDYFYDYDFTYSDLDTFKNALTSGYELRSLTYRYDFSYIKEGEPHTIRVYQAYFNFPAYNELQLYYGAGVSTYVTIVNNKMYVLTGAEEQGASVLEFENMVPVSEYFETLCASAALAGTQYHERTVYHNGELTDIYYDYMNLSYDAGNGKTDHYSFRVCYILVNGERKYVTNWVSTGAYLQMNQEVSDRIDAEDVIERYTATYLNGEFEFVSVEGKVREYFVKIAGTYYHYNNWNYIMDQERFEREFAETYDWYYGVYDEETDTWAYYNRFEYLYDYDRDEYDYVLSEPLQVVPTFKQEPWENYIGTLADGRALYELSGYVLGDVKTLKRSDGSIFYYRENSAKGFLQFADNMYVRAKMITDAETGVVTRIVCTDLSKAVIRSEALNRLGVLDKYVTKNDDGSVTISRDILEAIPEEVRDGFEIGFTRDSYSDAYLYYDQLKMWFDELKDTQSFASGYFNGFIGDVTSNEGFYY